MLNEGNQIHNFILCLWELLWFHFITGSVPLWQKLRFLRSRFRNTTLVYVLIWLKCLNAGGAGATCGAGGGGGGRGERWRRVEGGGGGGSGGAHHRYSAPGRQPPSGTTEPNICLISRVRYRCYILFGGILPFMCCFYVDKTVNYFIVDCLNP
jgi:hypothetical protein